VVNRRAAGQSESTPVPGGELVPPFDRLFEQRVSRVIHTRKSLGPSRHRSSQQVCRGPSVTNRQLVTNLGRNTPRSLAGNVVGNSPCRLQGRSLLVGHNLKLKSGKFSKHRMFI